MEDQVKQATEYIERMLKSFKDPKDCLHLASGLSKELVDTFNIPPEIAATAITRYFGVTLQ